MKTKPGDPVMIRSPFIRFIPLLLLALATSCLVGCDKDDDDEGDDDD